MDVHVLLQAHGVAEGFPADAAAERPAAAVRPAHVHLQAVGRGEHLNQGQSISGGWLTTNLSYCKMWAAHLFAGDTVVGV